MTKAELQELLKHIPPDNPRFDGRDLSFRLSRENDYWRTIDTLYEDEIDDCRNCAIAHWDLVINTGSVNGIERAHAELHLIFWRSWRKQ